MSAAARGAAGYLYASGRLGLAAKERRAQREAEEAAVALQRERAIAEDKLRMTIVKVIYKRRKVIA